MGRDPMYPLIYPHRLKACNGLTGTEADMKKAGNRISLRVSGLLWPLGHLYMVEVGGIDPPSEGTPSPALHA